MLHREESAVTTRERSVESYYSDFTYLAFLSSSVFMSAGGREGVREQLAAKLEDKIGNLASIRNYLRPEAEANAASGSLLLEVIENRPITSIAIPDSIDHEGIHKCIEAIGKYIIAEVASKVSVTSSSVEEIKMIMRRHYLLANYFNDHKKSINKVVLLSLAPYYLSPENLKWVVDNMNENDWQSFKYRLEQVTPGSASITEDIIRNNGLQFEELIAANPSITCHELLDVMRHAVMYNNGAVVKKCVNKYLSYESRPEDIKKLIEQTVLLALVKGDEAVCDSLLSKKICATYDVDTTSSILILIFDRPDLQPLMLKYIEKKNLKMNLNVMASFKALIIADDELRAEKVKYLQEIYGGEILNPPKLAGNVFVTPEDGTITHLELIEKAKSYGGFKEGITLFGEVLGKGEEKTLLHNMLANELIITTHSIATDYYPRVEGFRRFSETYMLGIKIGQAIGNYLPFDEIYGAYFNDNNISGSIDPVIKLLAPHITEVSSSQKVLSIREGAKDDRDFLRYLANIMCQVELPKKGGVLVDDIIYGDGEKANAIISATTMPTENTIFAGPEIAALRFAISHNKVNVVEHCLGSYLNKLQYIQVDDASNASIFNLALHAMIRGNLKICRMFLCKAMWSQYSDEAKVELINHIVLRSGKYTRLSLMDELLYNDVLTQELKEKLQKSLCFDRDEVNSFCKLYFKDAQRLRSNIKKCSDNPKTLEELIAEKPNKGNICFLLASITFACKKKFGDDVALEDFVKGNIGKFKVYENIEPKDLIELFGKADFLIDSEKILRFVKGAALASEVVAPEKKAKVKGAGGKPVKDAAPAVESNVASKKIVVEAVNKSAAVNPSTPILLNQYAAASEANDFDFTPVGKGGKGKSVSVVKPTSDSKPAAKAPAASIRSAAVPPAKPISASKTAVTESKSAVIIANAQAQAKTTKVRASAAISPAKAAAPVLKNPPVAVPLLKLPVNFSANSNDDNLSKIRFGSFDETSDVEPVLMSAHDTKPKSAAIKVPEVDPMVAVVTAAVKAVKLESPAAAPAAASESPVLLKASKATPVVKKPVEQPKSVFTRVEDNTAVPPDSWVGADGVTYFGKKPDNYSAHPYPGAVYGGYGYHPYGGYTNMVPQANIPGFMPIGYGDVAYANPAVNGLGYPYNAYGYAVPNYIMKDPTREESARRIAGSKPGPEEKGPGRGK